MAEKRFKYVLEKRDRLDGKKGWCVTLNGAMVISAREGIEWDTKQDTLDFAVASLNEWWKTFGQLSELTIRKKDGTFSLPRTYGKDPRRTKG